MSEEDDRVFKALADPTRRFLLDRLFERDGRTLTELESELEMTRFGVMKHLKVLADAGLVVARRSGREKRHFLNPVPIRLIHDRWIDNYTERQVSALADPRARRRSRARRARQRPLRERGCRRRPHLGPQRPQDPAGDRPLVQPLNPRTPPARVPADRGRLPPPQRTGWK